MTPVELVEVPCPYFVKDIIKKSVARASQFLGLKSNAVRLEAIFGRSLFRLITSLVVVSHATQKVYLS